MNKYQLVDRLLSNRYIYTISLILFCTFALLQDLVVSRLLLSLLIGIPAIFVWGYLFRVGISSQGKVMSFFNFIGRKTLDIYVLHVFFVYALHLPEVGKYLMGTHNVLIAMFLCWVISMSIIGLCLGVSQIISGSNILSTLLLGKNEWNV